MTQQNLKKLIKILLFVFIIQSFVFAEEKIKYTKQNDKIIFYQNGNEIAVVDNNVIQENEDAICWNLGSDYFLYNKKKGILEKELDWAYINEYGYVKKMNGKFYFTNKKGKTKIIISDYSILTPHKIRQRGHDGLHLRRALPAHRCERKDEERYESE